MQKTKIWAISLCMVFWAPISLCAFNPELAHVLAALRDEVEQGRLTSTEYTSFYEELTEDMECKDLFSSHEIIQNRIQEICSKAKNQKPSTLKFSLQQAIYPQQEIYPPTLLQAKWNAMLSKGEINFLDQTLFRRNANVSLGDFTVSLGHLHSSQKTHLSFIQGRNFFPQQKSLNVAEGWLSSSYPHLNGLGLQWEHGSFAAASHATWNPVLGADSTRNTIQQYSGFVLVQKPLWELSWQSEYSDFNFSQSVTNLRSRDFLLNGIKACLPEQGLSIGLGHSLEGRVNRQGLYGESQFKEGDSSAYFSLHIDQSSLAWYNPLPVTAVYSLDTLDGNVIVGAAGQGSLGLTTLFPLLTFSFFEDSSKVLVKTQTLATWSITEKNFSRRLADFALQEKLGHYWQSAEYSLNALENLETKSIIWSIYYRAYYTWFWQKVGYSLGYKGDSYHGSYSHPGEINWTANTDYLETLTLSVLTGNVFLPNKNLYFTLWQSWGLLYGIRLGGGFRLPWISGELSKEAYFQMRTDWAY